MSKAYFLIFPFPTSFCQIPPIVISLQFSTTYVTNTSKCNVSYISLYLYSVYALINNMIIFNLKTTVRNEALASSFIATESYFVSTVNQQQYQSSYPTKYSTIIKKSGGSFEPLLILNTDSAAEATANHIALIRMASSIDRDDWSKKGVVGYQPIVIMDGLKSESKEPNNFSSNYCRLLLSASQINITKKNYLPLIILAIAIVIVFLLFI